MNSLDNLIQLSILSLGIPKSLCAEKVENKFIKQRGSSKSLKASINVGNLFLIFIIIFYNLFIFKLLNVKNYLLLK